MMGKTTQYTHYEATPPKVKKAMNNVKDLYIATTHDQAKKMGLGEKTRVTGKEEQEFWKALAAAQVKTQKRTTKSGKTEYVHTIKL